MARRRGEEGGAVTSKTAATAIRKALKSSTIRARNGKCTGNQEGELLSAGILREELGCFGV